MKKKITIQLEECVLEKAKERANFLGISLSSYFSILAAQNAEQAENSFWIRHGMTPYCAGEPINTVQKPNLASGSGSTPKVFTIQANSANHAFVSLDDSTTLANGVDSMKKVLGDVVEAQNAPYTKRENLTS